MFSIIRERYADFGHADFGPTLACEKLKECHAIDLSIETVRRIMMDGKRSGHLESNGHRRFINQEIDAFVSVTSSKLMAVIIRGLKIVHYRHEIKQ